MDNQKYTVICKQGKYMYEHHTVLPPKDGYDVDHINGNGKDNRPENLRYLTRSQNAVHRDRENAGVDFHKATGKWRARLRAKHLGLFNSKKQALNVRKDAVTEYLTSE